jgi:hypothetical protein
MRWYAEVSDVTGDEIWVKVYEHDAAGRGTYGSLTDLADAVRQGKPVRLIGSNFNNQVERAAFPTTRVLTNQGHVFAGVPLFIPSFRHSRDDPDFKPYTFDAYLLGRHVSGISVFGTDGFERFRAADTADATGSNLDQLIPRALAWIVRT